MNENTPESAERPAVESTSWLVSLNGIERFEPMAVFSDRARAVAAVEQLVSADPVLSSEPWEWGEGDGGHAWYLPVLRYSAATRIDLGVYSSFNVVPIGASPQRLTWPDDDWRPAFTLPQIPPLSGEVLFSTSSANLPELTPDADVTCGQFIETARPFASGIGYYCRLPRDHQGPCR